MSSEDLLMDKLQFLLQFRLISRICKFYRKIWIIHDSRQEIYHPSRWPDPLTHGISKFKFLKWYFRKDTDWLFEAFGTWINSQEVLWKFNWDTRLKIIVNQTVLIRQSYTNYIKFSVILKINSAYFEEHV